MLGMLGTAEVEGERLIAPVAVGSKEEEGAKVAVGEGQTLKEVSADGELLASPVAMGAVAVGVLSEGLAVNEALRVG